MDRESAINPTSEGNQFIFVIDVKFSKNIVTAQTPKSCSMHLKRVISPQYF